MISASGNIAFNSGKNPASPASSFFAGMTTDTLTGVVIFSLPPLITSGCCRIQFPPDEQFEPTQLAIDPLILLTASDLRSGLKYSFVVGAHNFDMLERQCRKTSGRQPRHLYDPNLYVISQR